MYGLTEGEEEESGSSHVGENWRTSKGREANGPAAVAKTGPGTEQHQGHTELYCPYNAASVTP